MAAKRYQNDVLEMFFGPIDDENLPQPLQANILDEFVLSRNNFGGWLDVWRMEVSNENAQKMMSLSLKKQMKKSMLIWFKVKSKG